MSNALVYLGKVIDFKRSYSEESFLEEALRQALNAVIGQNCNAIALPSGENILVATAKVSTSAALYWLDIRGREAWSPTSNSPLPLFSLLKAKGVLRSKQEQWNAYNRVPDIYGKTDNFEALIESGLHHAMALRQNLATEDFMSDAANKKTIEAQAAVLRHILSLDSNNRLPKQIFDRLWDAFQEGRGALVFNGELLGMQLADKEVIKPKTQVWFADFADSKEFSQAAWVDHWRAQGGCKYASAANSHIVPWLENSGEDMSFENIILFISRIKNRFDRNASGEFAWQALCNEFSGFSDAWNIEEEGVLFWQNMLPRNPALLAYAIKNPPPTGMGQKSTSGLGIWDVIMPHSYNTFSTVALYRLHEKTKIDTTIQFSRPWYAAGIDLARATLADHPEGWVGKPSPKQDRWAVEMLVYLCSSLSQEEETAFQTYLLLIEDERHRATLGPVARGVLRVINHLHERGLLNKSVDSFKPLDQEGDKKWAAFVLRELPKKAKKLDVAADKIAAALSFVQNQALHDKTPASFPKQAHCPRRM